MLSLRYQGRTSLPVEVEGLTPTTVRGLSLAQIEKVPVHYGNRQAPIADFFAVSGDASDARIVFEGDLSGVHWIGAGMDVGSIHVEGHAGRHLGSRMAGGQITVTGNAGDWLGAEMRGGLIRVRGGAGHLAGGAYRGSRVGMTGGTIVVDGDAGDEVGHTMRRGTIAIGGRAGDCLGFNLIAGSLYVFGRCGIRPGAGMRRGTIGLFGPGPPPLLLSFRHAGEFRPDFLLVAARELGRIGAPFAERLAGTAVSLFHGDLLEQGRGEILLVAAAEGRGS